MGDQQPSGRIFILLSSLPTLPQLLWMLPETPYVLYMQLSNIRVTHRNGAIKHIFLHDPDPRSGSSADCSLFILSLHALALHLAVKILPNLFMKIWARWPYIHLSVVFPSRMPAGPHFVTQPILLLKTFLIFDINHQQNTRRSDQIETIKTIMQPCAPSYHMEGFTNGSGCHF